MATTKPRITITFEQETYDAIKEFAALTGMPMSKVVSEMTDQSVDSLLTTSALLKRAKDAPKAVLEAIGRDFKEAAVELVDRSSQFTAEYQEMVDGMDAIFEAGDGGQPPYINKGVRSTDSNCKPISGGASVVSGHFSRKSSK